MSNFVETLNGKAVHQDLVANRAFLYGDGLFTTIKLEQGKPRDLLLHWHRLQSDCKRLKIRPPECSRLNKYLDNTLRQWQPKTGIVRVTLYRTGGRGYKADNNAAAEIHISIQPFTKLASTVKLQSVTTALSRSKAIAGIKHLNRLEQVLIATELTVGFQEAVVLDTEGFVVEGMMSNIFFLKEEVFYTPDLSFAGVDGIARRKLIQGLQKQRRQLKIAFFGLDALLQAENVWICNAVQGVLAVSSIDQQSICINSNNSQLLEEIFREPHAPS